MKPKIAIIFAGGTIGMIQDPKTGSLTPAKDGKFITEQIPELSAKINIDFLPVFNIDSSNMTPNHWKIIADKIEEIYNQYDGFVVAQGTDTMSYSAAALSFAIQDLSKPIVFTGSIVPMSEIGADGRNNLIYSCLVATLDIAEVCVVFGNKIIRGNRAKKNHESFVDVFHSPNFPLLGEIERPIRLNEWRQQRSNKKPTFKPEFESNIRLIKLHPGFDPETFETHIEKNVKGIVIEGYGPGNVPFLDNSIIPKIEKLHAAGIPVIVTSQMEHSITNLDAYEAGFMAKQAGAISAQDMTTEATMAKLMWVLAHYKKIEDIESQMQANLAGELK
jgi:L-asparaginase